MPQGVSRPNHLLSAVLGPVRSQLLEAIDQPTAMSTLADRLNCLPRTVTYHSAWLETAGLVIRERKGQIVLLSRTRRGSELLALLQA